MDLIHNHHKKVIPKTTIRPPRSMVFKLIVRALLLASFIFLISWLGSLECKSFSPQSNHIKIKSATPIDPKKKAEFLPLLFHDLANEGLLKIGARSLLVSDKDDANVSNPRILGANGMDMISYSDSDRQSLIPNETFDFAFAQSFMQASTFIDRTLKVGGIAALKLSEMPSFPFPKPKNYKIVYLRKLGSTILAMRKTSSPGDHNKPAVQRRLFGVSTEAKKEALKKLEDVLLEPPRATKGRKSRRYLKRTRYLPDLTGDNLESYPRRVFIDVGAPGNKKSGDTGWFAKHYPTRNKDFEIYKIEVPEEEEGEEAAEIGISEWLRENVSEEEYVVMKAEAEVVEEMVRSRATVLVDELFMECRHQGWKKSRKSRRAYWECLALYGKLRDEGVAVHQWWG